MVFLFCPAFAGFFRYCQAQFACMAPLHAKSPCCDAPVRRFGKRRKQCIHCKRTWRVRKKKRGRKRTRHIEALLKRILIDGHTLSHEKHNFHGLKVVSIAARFARALRAHVATSPPSFPKGPYALIVDGAYFKFKRKEWVLYLMALKPTHSRRMYFLDPVLKPGREKIEVWHEVVDTIPQSTREQMKALVSDGSKVSRKPRAGYTSGVTFISFHLWCAARASADT